MFKKIVFLSIVSIISTQAMDRSDPLTVTVILKNDWTHVFPVNKNTTVDAIASSAISKLVEVHPSKPMVPMALAVTISTMQDTEEIETIDNNWKMRIAMDRYRTHIFKLVEMSSASVV